MEPDYPTCFHLGVVAPPRFEVPDLGERVWARLYPMLGPRLSRRERISLVTVGFEPVSREMAGLWREKGWPEYTVGGGYAARDHRRGCAHVSVIADALVIVHGGELCRDMKALTRWCEWLGVAWRAVRLDG